MCNNNRHTFCFDNTWCVFTRGPTAKVFTGYHDFASFHVWSESCINIFHRMFSQFVPIGNRQVTSRNDYVCIYIVAVAPDFFAFKIHIKPPQGLQCGLIQHLLPPRKGLPNILQNQRDPYDHGSYGLLWKLCVPLQP